jgi:hypothetical protein
LFTGGADDRYVTRLGAWHTDDGGLMVLFPATGKEDAVRFRVVEGSPHRLVVAP